MISHAPDGYVCPFCRNLNEGVGDFPVEIIRRYPEVTVKLNPKWWPRNKGAVLVVPNRHYENVYELPVELGSPIQRAVRDAALAMKLAFECDGISTRQHNEPAGNQDVWHYHVHVFPRYEGDELYFARETYWPAEQEMRDFADRLRAAWPP